MNLSKSRSIVFILAAGGLLMLTMIIVVTQPGRAAGPWYVAPGGSDGNDCLSPATPCATINGALGKASSGDTIFVATGTYTGTGGEVVLLDKSATLSGGWDETFTTQSGTSAIEGEETHRGITVDTGVTAVIDRFAVQHGYIDFGNGGGIHNSGILTMTNSMIDHNYCYHLGGGIYNQGTLTLNNCTISGNSADWVGDGGGIGNDGALTLNSSTVSDNNFGGIYSRSGTLTLNGSTVSGNPDGGILCDNGTAVLNNSTVHGNNWTGINNGGTVTLISSTVSANTGRGISNDGTAVLNNSTISGNTDGGIDNEGTVTLDNSTVSDNNMSGIRNVGTLTLNSSTISDNFGGIYNGGTLTLNNSTISGNTDGGIVNDFQRTLILNSSTVSGNSINGDGGGIYNNDGTVTLQNTILAGNTASGAGPDCSGYAGSGLGSAGYNLVGDTSDCNFSSTTGDLFDVDPRLFPLIGLPGYHPLRPGSPAIDAGNPASCTDHMGNPLDTDQRGFPRFGRCDIGAYEMQPIGFSTKSANETSVGAGHPLTYTIALTNGGAVDINNVHVTDTLPISVTYVYNSLTATSGSYGYDTGVVTWTGSVNAGASVTITFGATVNETTPLGASIANSAIISGGGEVITRTAIIIYVGHRVYLPLVMR